MTEHSPGPWYPAAVSDGAWVSDRDGFYVAEIDGETAGYGPEPKRMSANARLIAAAPELLAALEAIQMLAVAAQYYSYGYDYDACVTDVRKRAESAIAIAYGERAGGMKERGGNDAE